jgi:hypothetical protein
MMVRRSMNPRSAICFAIIAGAIQVGLAGCYYPAKLQAPAPAKTRILVNVPYDLTWDAVHTVVGRNEYKILGDDPNDGIIEAEAHSFTLADADCGQMKSIANRYEAEPDPGGSAVYNFKVEPAGPEATNLSVNATYSTPLHVPFHPVSDFQCISRGNQEVRLLKEVDTAAHSERRPNAELDKPRQPTPGGRPTLLRPDSENSLQPAPERPSLLKPDFLKKPGAPED